MPHLFVSPHPDDAALSCGGLIAGLRARGEQVTILTVFCGPGPSGVLSPYQRLALGFGEEEPWRSAPEADTPASREARAEGEPTPAGVMAVRRAEDEAYARSVGASIEFAGLPDGVFRGYESDAELSGSPRPDDPAPIEALREALGRLRPAHLYLPLSVGGHVDHRQVRRAGIALLAEPGSPYQDRTRFWEDFPYALNTGFERLDQLDPEILPSLPAGVTLTPEYVEIAGTIDRKLAGLRAYESQLGRLFGGGGDPTAVAVRERAARVGELGGIGLAERYWRLAPSRPPRRRRGT